MADLAPDQILIWTAWGRSAGGIIHPKGYLEGLYGIAGVKTILGVELLSNDLEACPPPAGRMLENS